MKVHVGAAPETADRRFLRRLRDRARANGTLRFLEPKFLPDDRRKKRAVGRRRMTDPLADALARRGMHVEREGSR